MVPGDDSESSPSEDDTALRTVVLGLNQDVRQESLETDRAKTNDVARGLMARIDSFAAAADAYVASLNP